LATLAATRSSHFAVQARLCHAVRGLLVCSSVRRALHLCLFLICVLVPCALRAQTVDDVVATHRGGCTTAGFEGLSEQLVRSHLCAYPGVVEEFTPHSGIALTSSRVHPLAVAETVRALRAAAEETPFAVNSAFRPLVQQYALYHEGGCGLAATPGNSNHQSGRAVDVDNYGAARAALLRAGCTHPYPSSDPVHFDCPGSDMRAASVLVFQRLWNANHPADPIAEDSAYGPETAARLAQSPVGGFPADLCIVRGAWGAELVSSTFEGVVTLVPGEALMGTIELRNTGTEGWTPSTELATTGPRDAASLLADSSWVSERRPAAVEGSVPPGESYPFTFVIRAPDLAGDYVQTFGLVEAGETWFADELGPPDDAIAVRVAVTASEVDGGFVDVDGGTPVDGGWMGGGDRPLSVGGCSVMASSRGGTWWLFGLVLIGLGRARARQYHL